MTNSRIERQVAWPEAGRYVLAVSGGADSMVLLNLMAAAAPARGYQLVVGHVDHGLRSGSADDRRFVAAAAERYGIPFYYYEAALGQASEAAARQARHTWLEAQRRHHRARAVLTAHHADDILETSLLNLARGSGRRGLAPMQAGPILRPLVNLTRVGLRAYAAERGIGWREDPTNADLSNPRNYLRLRLLPAAGPVWRQRYGQMIGRLAELNGDIDRRLAALFEPGSWCLTRATVRDLSLAELAEAIAFVARQVDPGIELAQRLLAELALFAKTARPGTRRPVRAGLWLVASTSGIEITRSQNA